MPVIEISPPDHPFREDVTAPVIYLTGIVERPRELAEQAMETFYSLSRFANTVYVANRFRAFEPRDPETLRWRRDYQARAATNGSFMVWLSGKAFDRIVPEDLRELLVPHSKWGSAVACGLAKNAHSSLRRELSEKLTPLGLDLFQGLEATCAEAIRLALLPEESAANHQH